jgi:SAM-dependent methyltransferase
MTDVDDPMTAEFDTVAEWTAQVARALGPEYFIPAGCRGSGQPSALDWLLKGMLEGVQPTADERQPTAGEPQPPTGELLIDVGAGVGGPAAYAAERTGVRPVLAEPEPGACRAAASLFDAPVVQADAVALPWPDASAGLIWSLGVLCTVTGPEHQLAMLREMRRVLRPGGRIGLLVFLATTPRLDDPPQGNHFPTPDQLTALLEHANLEIVRQAGAVDLPPPSPDWQHRTAAVERELQRRFGRTAPLATASEQSDRIGRLLSSGQLTERLLILRGRPR